MLFVYLLVSALIIGMDQGLKFWIVDSIALGGFREFIPNVLSLTYVRNTGAAWSLLEGQMWFFLLATVVVVSIAIYYLIKNVKGSRWLNFGISLIIAGALGNIIDRIRLGFVVDMFRTEFMNFPIFNIADCSLVIGVALIMIYLFMEDRKERKNESN